MNTRSPRRNAVPRRVAWVLAALAVPACTRRPAHTHPAAARADRSATLVPPTGPLEHRAFVLFALDAARAVLAAAHGLPHESRWDGPSAATDLRATRAAVRTGLAALGGEPEFVALVQGFGGRRTGDFESADFDTGTLVFQDGRVRWLPVTVRVTQAALAEDPGVLELHQVSQAAPVLLEMFEYLLRVEAGPCNLPAATRADLAVFPPDVQGGLLGEGVLPREACPRFTPGGWRPRFRAFTVLAQAQGRWVGLVTHPRLEGAHLVLGPVTMETLR